MRIIVIVFICIVITGILLSAYWFFTGTPWGKCSVRKETEEYLRKKYSSRMVIDKVFFELSDMHYWVIAYPVGKINLKFKVSKTGDEITDNYLLVLWTDEVNSELNLFVKKVYFNGAFGIISISRNPIYHEIHPKVKKLPNYREIKDKISLYSDIYIVIQRGFDKENSDKEYMEMYKILQFVKPRYGFKDIEFSFCPEESLRHCKKYVVPYNKINEIEVPEDLRKFSE